MEKMEKEEKKEQLETTDFKQELSWLKKDILNKDGSKEQDKSHKQEEINKLEKSGNYRRDQEKKTLWFFYNITEGSKRDAEVYLKDDGDNLIVSIDAYNTYGRNGEDIDLAKSFKKSELDKVPSYLKDTFAKWFNFETAFGLDENLKVKSSKLLEKIENKAEWAVKLFSHYTEIKKESKEI